jgi:hypothetical protein
MYRECVHFSVYYIFMCGVMAGECGCSRRIVRATVLAIHVYKSVLFIPVLFFFPILSPLQISLLPHPRANS